MSKLDCNCLDYGSLYKKLDYQFKNPDLLKEALTHSSVGPKRKSYERLEFLGDRVLGLVISNMLFHYFSEDSEGDLSKRFTKLVRKETLAHLALKIGLNNFIIMAKGEKVSGGSKKQTLLADVCEAIIASIFIDGGLKAAENFIKIYWTDILQSMKIPPKDPKSVLQEWTQSLGLANPKYSVLETIGPAHKPQFVVELIIEGKNPIIAKGASKRTAEKKAAEILLKNLK